MIGDFPRRKMEEPMSNQSSSAPERRSFLTSWNAGVAALAAIAFGRQARAQAKPAAATRWEPARHDKDDWFDQLPGKHRLVFDTTSLEHVASSLLFANNFIRVNQADYGLQPSELAVVIIVRHRSTPFGYTDAMWAKYGAPIAARSQVEDPKTKQPPKVNMFTSANYSEFDNRGMTLDSVFKQGVQLAVCATSTRGYAAAIAQATGGQANAIFEELAANLVPNSRLVPAGIVAVNRAQERGYSLVSI
jgi:intracellular sulfur oxidation DsrE/DsrF family protein